MAAAQEPQAGTVTVYIAARPQDHARALALRATLKHHGIGCTARWLEESADGRARVEDVQRADVLVFLNPNSSHRTGAGGPHTEFGIALGAGKPVVLFGAPENGFQLADQDIAIVPDGTPAERLVVTVQLAAKFGTPLPVKFGVTEGAPA